MKREDKVTKSNRIGPFYVDVDVAVEMEQNITHVGIPEEFRRELSSYRVGWKKLEGSGVGDGTPRIRLRGSRRSLKRWLSEKYHDDGSHEQLIRRVERHD